MVEAGTVATGRGSVSSCVGGADVKSGDADTVSVVDIIISVSAVSLTSGAGGVVDKVASEDDEAAAATAALEFVFSAGSTLA